MCGCLLHTPTGDLAYNPGMCLDWESNQQPFGSQASTQSTDPHQPGLYAYFNMRTNTMGSCMKAKLIIFPTR